MRVPCQLPPGFMLDGMVCSKPAFVFKMFFYMFIPEKGKKKTMFLRSFEKQEASVNSSNALLDLISDKMASTTKAQS